MNVGNGRSYGSELIADARETGDSGCGFGKAVAYHHIYAAGMEKFGDFRRQRSARRGEDIAVLNAYHSLQGLEKLLLGKTVAHFEPPGHLVAQTHVVNIATLAYFQRPVGKPAAEAVDCGEFVLNGGIDLFPESGHGAHARGTDLLYAVLDFMRVGVYSHGDSAVETEVVPGFFKNMAQRQKTHRNIAVTYCRESFDMDFNGSGKA